MTTRAGFSFLPQVPDPNLRQALQRLERLVDTLKTQVSSLATQLAESQATLSKVHTRVVNVESRLVSEAGVTPTTAAVSGVSTPIIAPDLSVVWLAFAAASPLWPSVLAGNLNACAQLCVDFAASLNPSNDPLYFGALSKTAGESHGVTTVGLAAIDAIIFTNLLTDQAGAAPSGVVDLLTGAGGTSPVASWDANKAKRAVNNWVAPS